MNPQSQFGAPSGMDRFAQTLKGASSQSQTAQAGGASQSLPSSQDYSTAPKNDPHYGEGSWEGVGHVSYTTPNGNKYLIVNQKGTSPNNMGKPLATVYVPSTGQNNPAYHDDVMNDVKTRPEWKNWNIYPTGDRLGGTGGYTPETWTMGGGPQADASFNQEFNRPAGPYNNN